MNLKEAYNQDLFLEYIQEFIPGFAKDIRKANFSGSLKTIKEAKYLGNSEELELSVFELKVNGSAEKKISQARDGFRIMKEYQVYRALMAYFSDEDQNWRFSLMQMNPDLSEKGKIITTISNPRRYSFYLGPDAKIKTPEKYLIKDGEVKDFDDLLKRFSVEVVNKDFYKDIARFFNRLVGGDVKLTSKAEHFESEIDLPSIDKSNKRTYQEFSVRLIGRIIFCWFLKQKKSENNISLLPEEFLSVGAVEKNNNYYHNILEKIFFEVLNKQINERNRELTNGYGKIPYLNGGLFGPQADDFYENQPNWELKIPDKWFKNLFEILETYNFTIDENTVIDADLSIDPEMLGRIFENLLAEINPETGQSARKSTGSYYTPRPIVEYMVDQSLIQYLLNKTKIQEDKIRALITIDEFDDEQFPLNDEDRQRIVNALDEVKIIDPACGSGAFPMGVLQKVVFILGKVDLDGKLWFEKKMENLDLLLKDDFKKKFENENFDYIRKTGVIRDSIYGVDIQPIAVEVTKLRCFLTLVVDEDIDDNSENRGIKPLPNLEFKFVAANTLIDLPGSAISNNGQMEMFESKNEIEQLKEIRDRYFVSNGSEKEKCKIDFDKTRIKMFQSQRDRNFKGVLTNALADWDPFSNKSSNWFDPEWMFGIKNFDIVIANPPYVNISNLDKISRNLYKKIFSITKNKIDLYAYFLKKGGDLLKSNATLCYIIPHTWKATSSFEKLRKLIFTDFKLESIVEMEQGAFDATVKPVVVVLIKDNCNQYDVKVYNYKFDLINRIPMRVILNENNYALDTTSSKKERSLFYKIELNSEKLGNILKFTRGIKTSDDKRFIKNNKENENCKKVIRGRNIQKYFYNWNNEYIWYRPDLMKEKVGCLPHSKELFEVGEKIVLQRISKGLSGCLDKMGTYALDTCLVSDNKTLNKKFELKFLLSLINSKLLNFWYHKKFVLPTVSGYELDQLPIIKLSIEDQIPLVNLVDDILNITKSEDYINSSKKQSSVKEYEKQIDEMVYKLYNLTPEEIKIVENNI